MLTFAGLAVGFASGLVSQLAVTSTVDMNGRKALTVAGRLAIAISILGFLCSLGSQWLKTYIDVIQLQEKRLLLADEANQKRIELAKEESRRRDDLIWKKRSEQLGREVLGNTRREISYAEKSFAKTFESFRQQNLLLMSQRLAISRAELRILSPMSGSEYLVSVKIPCGDGGSTYCTTTGASEFIKSNGGLNVGGQARNWRPKNAFSFNMFLCIIKDENDVAAYLQSVEGGGCNIAFAITSIYDPSAVDTNDINSLRVSASYWDFTLSTPYYRPMAKGYWTDGKLSSFYDITGGFAILVGDREDFSDSDLQLLAIRSSSGEIVSIRSCKKMPLTKRFVSGIEKRGLGLPLERVAFLCRIPDQFLGRNKPPF